MKVKIKIDEIREYLDIDTCEFAKYVNPLINLANQYAQGTRPKVVGQMSELILQFKGKTLPEWEKWYFEQRPDAITKATEKILLMLKNFQKIISKIDREMVESWVKDLVIVKTFIGLRFQVAILKKIAKINKTTYRLAQPEEESRGIDGYIGNIPISIKPHTYEAKLSLPENINIKIIYYKKLHDGIEINYDKI